MMTPKEVRIEVCWNRLLRTTWALALREISMTMRMPSRSDSSRRSVMPSIFLSRTRSAICLTSFALLTW
ncbi:MAG: hypothetical protein BWY66_00817 [bacterium ADurb.Bin374]|nr:MAG: hypothetical protein BWY66_00817 [bacterium ADurb.Bin374]